MNIKLRSVLLLLLSTMNAVIEVEGIRIFIELLIRSYSCTKIFP